MPNQLIVIAIAEIIINSHSITVYRPIGINDQDRSQIFLHHRQLEAALKHYPNCDPKPLLASHKTGVLITISDRFYNVLAVNPFDLVANIDCSKPVCSFYTQPFATLIKENLITPQRLGAVVLAVDECNCIFELEIDKFVNPMIECGFVNPKSLCYVRNRRLKIT